jgi:arylformamidase
MSEFLVHEGEYLDQQYNPRLHIPGHASIFARWRNSAQLAREGADVRLDVPYGPTPAERLDFFRSSRGTSPLLIFVHGGYWRALDKDDFSWIAPPYVQAGVSVAVVNYGLMPTVPLDRIVQQVRRACAWLYENAASLDIRAGEIFCSGHSAGGHLTAMMLATDWPEIGNGLPQRLLAGGISVSGVFDLEPLTRAPFLREDLRLDAAGARALSPAYLPQMNEAPLVRAVGALETDEFHRQSGLLEPVWPAACQNKLIRVLDRNHITVCEALAEPQSALYGATRALIAGAAT